MTTTETNAVVVERLARELHEAGLVGHSLAFWRDVALRIVSSRWHRERTAHDLLMGALRDVEVTAEAVERDRAGAIVAAARALAGRAVGADGRPLVYEDLDPALQAGWRSIAAPAVDAVLDPPPDLGQECHTP